jgi:phospholipase A1
MIRRWAALAAAAAAVFALPAFGQDATAVSITQCRAVQDPARRLACYDRLAVAEARTVLAPDAANAGAPPPRVAPAGPGLSAPAPPAAGSLAAAWELEPAARRGVFQVRAYRPVYLLVNTTSSPNRSPSSPAPGHALPADYDINRSEAKMQLSFKVKALENIAHTDTDLWLAYTQLSLWQVANKRYSSPFRDNVYEPEALLTHAWRLPAFAGGGAGLVGLGLDHQSNGHTLPLSRSWNRLIGMVGGDFGAWTAGLRTWKRLRESAEDDDNPDIADYLGRAELLLTRRLGERQTVSLLARHTLKGGERSRGSLQLDWSFPISGTLRGQLQAFHGYGPTLADYNHRQTTFGFGVSLGGWD